MLIRPVTTADLLVLGDIDATVESTEYLHLDQSGEGLSIGWRVEKRSLREKLIQSNPIDEETRFALQQVTSDADEGIALMAEHDDAPVALLLAVPRHDAKTLDVRDLRIDYEFRRQGLATAMVFQVIAKAREMEFRAVHVQARANNLPANQFFLKNGFELSGLDTRRHSNHDIVKESATLLWYASLD